MPKFVVCSLDSNTNIRHLTVSFYPPDVTEPVVKELGHVYLQTRHLGSPNSQIAPINCSFKPTECLLCSGRKSQTTRQSGAP